MKIYFAHSTSYDYLSQLYAPLRLWDIFYQHQFILPHETHEYVNSKDVIRQVDLVIAEVSHASTGLGIELGWANSFGIPVTCIYKDVYVPSRSIYTITDKVVAYSDENDMLEKLDAMLKE